MAPPKVHRIEVRVPLPFFLRAEEDLQLPYEKLCADDPLPQLLPTLVRISFETWTPPATTPAQWQWPNTLLVISVDSPSAEEDTVDKFAIRDCSKICNHLIRCYQAAT